MTEILDALVGLLLFNLLLMSIIVVARCFDDRRKRGRRREATGRLAPCAAPQPRVPTRDPFEAAIGERRTVLSAHHVDRETKLVARGQDSG